MANEEYPFCPKCNGREIEYSQYAVITARVNFIRNQQRTNERIDTEEWVIEESDTPHVMAKPFACMDCGKSYNMNQLGFTETEPDWQRPKGRD
jgi:hypothetical protein